MEIEKGHERHVWVDRRFPPFMQGALPPELNLHYATDHSSGPDINLLDMPSEIRNRITGAIVYEHPQIDGAFLDAFPNCRYVSNFGVGVPHIECEELRQRGVVVTNTPHILQDVCADLVVGLIIVSARKILPSCLYAMSSDFERYNADLFMGMALKGKILGIFGMGEIGVEVARRMKPFGMKVLYNNRNRVSRSVEYELGADWRSLDDLCRESDVLVTLASQTSETVNAIGPDRIGLMKSTTHVINPGRGALVDNTALAWAVRLGVIAGVAVDVTYPLEPLPRNHPLVEEAKIGRVVMTSHIASAVEEVRLAMLQRAVLNLLMLYANQPQNVVN